MKVQITAKTKWAKERVKRHGPVFTLVKEGHPQCANGEHAIFVSAENGWHGWFTDSDITTEGILNETQDFHILDRH